MTKQNPYTPPRPDDDDKPPRRIPTWLDEWMIGVPNAVAVVAVGIVLVVIAIVSVIIAVAVITIVSVMIDVVN